MAHALHVRRPHRGGEEVGRAEARRQAADAGRSAEEEVVSVLYLFDIDGTLLHAHRSGRDAFDAVFASQHGVENASEGIRYGGKTDPSIVEEIFVARLGRKPEAREVAAFLDAYLPRLRELLANTGVEVLAGVVESLQFLSERNISDRKSVV